jgi:myo-inositol 2-dehydrogenase/D-chiro-inositol 1-dehydrogenase
MFVETPLTTTLEKGAEINAAVNKAGIVAAVGYNWRSTAVTKTARELMSGKKVSAAYGFWVEGMPGVMWWRQQAQSGGQLNEQATHIVDIARHLIGGKIVKVFAQGSKGICSKKAEKHDMCDNIIALFTFDSGAVVSVATGHTSPQGYRVGIDFVLEDMGITHANGELRVKTREKEEIIKNSNRPYEEEDRAFVEAIRKKDPQGVYCTYADAFETHRACMAANESVETGVPVILK